MDHHNYSDEEYSDDEYAPLEATTWGAQPVARDGKVEFDISLDGWNSLIDPSIKLKRDGIGSGQLHRQGGHYKPLDEKYILQQRLGKPIPKALGGGKKKSSRGGRGGRGGSRGGSSGGSLPPRRPPSQSSYASPSRPGREPPANSGPWGSGQLADTPFWEQSASSATTGSYASKYASPPPPTARQAPPPQQPQQNHHTTPAPAPAPAPAFQQQQQQPIYTSAPSGSMASKYATPSALAPAPAPAPAQPAQVVYKAQHNPVGTIQLEEPVLTLNIELPNGVNSRLLAYADDTALEATQKWAKAYNLDLEIMTLHRVAESVHEAWNKQLSLSAQ